MLTITLGFSSCTLSGDAKSNSNKSIEIGNSVQKRQKKVKSKKPNIVIVITDDQGYGDLGCTGNPVIKTPHTDKLANESIWLTDYHVAPTCSPTRAALMSGHWTNRTGVWHTIMGRSMLRANEVLWVNSLRKMDMRQACLENGIWEIIFLIVRKIVDLLRSIDMEVGSKTPDVWDNAYFDGGYFHNGKIVQAKDFVRMCSCEQGNKFIRESVRKKKSLLPTFRPMHRMDLSRLQKYLDMLQRSIWQDCILFWNDY